MNIPQQQFQIALAGQIQLVGRNGGKFGFEPLQVSRLPIDRGARVILKLRIVLVETVQCAVRRGVMKVDLVEVVIGQLTQRVGIRAALAPALPAPAYCGSSRLPPRAQASTISDPFANATSDDVSHEQTHPCGCLNCAVQLAQ